MKDKDIVKCCCCWSYRSFSWFSAAGGVSIRCVVAVWRSGEERLLRQKQGLLNFRVQRNFVSDACLFRCSSGVAESRIWRILILVWLCEFWGFARLFALRLSRRYEHTTFGNIFSAEKSRTLRPAFFDLVPPASDGVCRNSRHDDGSSLSRGRKVPGPDNYASRIKVR